CAGDLRSRAREVFWRRWRDTDWLAAGALGTLGTCTGGRRSLAAADGGEQQGRVDGAGGGRSGLPAACAVVTARGRRLRVQHLFQPAPEQLPGRRRNRVPFLGKYQAFRSLHNSSRVPIWPDFTGVIQCAQITAFLPEAVLYSRLAPHWIEQAVLSPTIYPQSKGGFHVQEKHDPARKFARGNEPLFCTGEDGPATSGQE